MLKRIAVAALAGSALLAASGAAQARHNDHGYRHYNHGYHHHRHYRHAPRVVYRPVYRPYYRPAPSYYYPPAYYYEPAPAIYGRIPIGNGSIGFRLPL